MRSWRSNSGVAVQRNNRYRRLTCQSLDLGNSPASDVVMAINPGYLILGAAALLAAGFLRYQRRAAAGGSFVKPDDPLWSAAVARARETAQEMQQLHAAGHLVLVKFPFQTDQNEREHVWGSVLGVSEQALRVNLETPPRRHRGKAPSELTVPIAELEDWQVELPDGSIRGGFTTQAEIELARREGRPVPAHIAGMEGRFQGK